MDATVKTRIDRRDAKRIVPMRCLALGMPRTGTHSLRRALQILGLNDCYHQETLIHNPDDGALWTKALESRNTSHPFGRAEWDALLGHCQAVCDIPAVHFGKELMDAYPNANVILTTRDVDAWHRSISETIEKRYRNKLVYALSFVDKVTWLWTRPFYLGWDELFSGDFERNGRAVYHAHNERLRKLTPPHRLLEYHVSQGWKPLCAFLDLPIPDEPFPNGNDQAGFHVACNALDRHRLAVVCGKAFGVGVFLLAAFKVYSTSYT